MKTKIQNSSRHLRTGLKVAIGVAIAIALLWLGIRKLRGEAIDRFAIDPVESAVAATLSALDETM